MIKNFEDIVNLAKTKVIRILSVAVAQDEGVLRAVKYATDEGIIQPILVGDKEEIEKIANIINMSLDNIEICHVIDKTEACRVAVSKVTMGEADMLMKGIVDTAILLKEVLKKEANLRTGRVISHVGVIDAPTYSRILLVSDAAMTIAPDLITKKQIIENSVIVAKSIGISTPKVAVICAIEKVNDKMPATVDAKKLEEMNKKGEIRDCIVGGPLALDNAVSIEAAQHKNIDNPVAGNADVLITPLIEAGNILYKTVSFIGDAKVAGVLAGAKVPIIVTSRADSKEAKLNSIALAMLMASN